MEAIVALVNASFDKLMFVAGVFFLLVMVFCKKPVQFRYLRLPAIDWLGRAVSGLIGTGLIVVPVWMWTSSADVRLISVPPRPNSEVLQQDKPTKIRLSNGEEIGLLAHSIMARRPSKIVIFKLDNITRGLLDREISYDSFVAQIGRDRIICEESITQGGTYRFAYQGRNYTVKVDQVLWNFIGPDYVVVTIEERP